MSPRNLCTPGARYIGKSAVLVVAALSWLVVGVSGLAQTNPNQPTVIAPPPLPPGIPEAPVGHRQPRPSELPAETRREENSPPARPATDLLPSICVKC